MNHELPTLDGMYAKNIAHGNKGHPDKLDLMSYRDPARPDDRFVAALHLGDTPVPLPPQAPATDGRLKLWAAVALLAGSVVLAKLPGCTPMLDDSATKSEAKAPAATVTQENERF